MREGGILEEREKEEKKDDNGIETELLKNEIETSQGVLLREWQDLRKQSARLKKQAARMTETQRHALLNLERLPWLHF